MFKYIAINKTDNLCHGSAKTKKKLLEILGSLHPDDEIPNEFYIVEIIDTISICTKTIIETTIMGSDGREMKIDARDRFIPTERNRDQGKEEEREEKRVEEKEEVDSILAQVGLD